MQKKNVTKQTVSAVQQKKMEQGKSPKLSWWQLSLIGVGSVIGAGFFLGTGLSIHSAGPSVLIGYLLAGLTAFFVFHALAEMTVRDPQPGSFRTYAGQAFGHVMGFTSGWVYWTAGVLIMSSEVTALSIFTQFWFKSIPLWIFAIIYSVLALGINLFGVKKFGTVESFFAVIKLATLIIFIAFIALVISGVIHPGKEVTDGWSSAFRNGIFTNGFTGFWSALIFILFSYGGIEMLGVLSNELRHPKEIPLAGRTLVLVLTILYIGSIFLIISVVSWTKISEDKSPFVEALSNFHIPYLDSIFNVILISAAFSTMVGALFSITSIMISLAKDGDAPSRLKKKNKKGVAVGALLLSGAGLGVTVILSFFLPDTVYEYMTTAAGIMLILNWMIILSSHIKKKKQLDDESDTSYFSTPFASYIGIFLILFSIGGALLHHNQRVGFYISIGFVAVIQIAFRVGSRFGYFQKVHKSEEEY
ncbi:amino acid permease [Fictibacillus barbaricus]|uniref:L-asparagine transporter-like permease n=1 Tax=Fictibacillus barbaricus TaxID=182136 RepID=A0ABU1U0Y7_9BACL|nr:amino acid permease [Fictibacillus barbaricus]MDR7073125.1 L-asparagine transporter-like permease [Fictibacillus barbaricus]